MVIKTIPKKKKCNKAKRLFEDSLQIAEKGREVKDREEERYIPETETVTYFIFGAPESLQMVIAAMKLKKTLASWKKNYDKPR